MAPWPSRQTGHCRPPPARNYRLDSLPVAPAAGATDCCRICLSVRSSHKWRRQARAITSKRLSPAPPVTLCGRCWRRRPMQDPATGAPSAFQNRRRRARGARIIGDDSTPARRTATRQSAAAVETDAIAVAALTMKVCVAILRLLFVRPIFSTHFPPGGGVCHGERNQL